MTNTKKILVERTDPVLRLNARKIEESEIGTKKIDTIINKMKLAMHAENDGVAIAAPQIGESLRIFVVNGEVLALTNKKKVVPNQELFDLVFINPEIIKTSKKKKKMEEGCLSVRWLYGKVERYEKVTLKAQDQNGKLVTIGASGLLAQIFQHETDHLNGILFIDKAEEIEDLPPTTDLKSKHEQKAK